QEAMVAVPPMAPGQPFDGNRYFLLYGTEASNDDVPAPPPAASPPKLDVEDALVPPSLRPLADPVPGSILRLIWPHAGIPSRCEMRPLPQAPFFTADCGQLSDPAWLGNQDGQLVAMDDALDGTMVVTTDYDYDKTGIVSGKTEARLWTPSGDSRW